MNNTITFTYTLTTGGSGTKTFTGNDNCSQLFLYLATTLGQDTLKTATLSGNGYGSANLLFANCSNLMSLNMTGFNTSNITSMSNMFTYCESLTSLNVSMFDVSNVTNTGAMFFNCTNLQVIYANSDWKTGRISTSSSMFYGCTNLVGAIPYDSSKVDINYANPTTGYFTPGPSSKNIYVNRIPIEHIIVNGVEMSSVYVNGNRII